MAYQVYSMMNMMFVVILAGLFAMVVVESCVAVVCALCGVKSKSKAPWVVACIAMALAFLDDLAIGTLSLYMTDNGGVLDKAGLVFLVVLLPFIIVRYVVFIISFCRREKHKEQLENTLNQEMNENE